MGETKKYQTFQEMVDAVADTLAKAHTFERTMITAHAVNWTFYSEHEADEFVRAVMTLVQAVARERQPHTV